MTGFLWFLTAKVSALLHADERAVVLGDLEEYHASGGQALRGLLGLAVRRQAALWKDWRPWLALAGIVGLAGVRLNHLSFLLAAWPSQMFWTYWKYGVRYENGLSTLEIVEVFLCHSLALAVWAWTCGCALAMLSRRTLWITGIVYFVVCAYPLRMLGYVFVTGQFLKIEARPLLILLAIQLGLQTIFFALPTLHGVRRGRRDQDLPLPQSGALAAATLTLALLSAWVGGWGGAAITRWSGGDWDASPGWWSRLVPFALLSLPALYLLGRSLTATPDASSAADGAQRH